MLLPAVRLKIPLEQVWKRNALRLWPDGACKNVGLQAHTANTTGTQLQHATAFTLSSCEVASCQKSMVAHAAALRPSLICSDDDDKEEYLWDDGCIQGYDHGGFVLEAVIGSVVMHQTKC